MLGISHSLHDQEGRYIGDVLFAKLPVIGVAVQLTSSEMVGGVVPASLTTMPVYGSSHTAYWVVLRWVARVILVVRPATRGEVEAVVGTGG